MRLDRSHREALIYINIPEPREPADDEIHQLIGSPGRSDPYRAAAGPLEPAPLPADQGASVPVRFGLDVTKDLHDELVG